MYEVELFRYQPEILIEDEPEKYEYEYGRYKNVFVFVISKSELERHKQLNINDGIDGLEIFLSRIRLDYKLDFLDITSENNNNYIITNYIKPSLYKENIKEDKLPL